MFIEEPVQCQNVDVGEGYLKQPFQVNDGYVDLPRGPGLSIEIDEDALAEKLGHDWKNRQTFDRRDGSVVDW
jgi:galactonate dehydratase